MAQIRITVKESQVLMQHLNVSTEIDGDTVDNRVIPAQSFSFKEDQGYAIMKDSGVIFFQQNDFDDLKIGNDSIGSPKLFVSTLFNLM
jgi:hypothetical protein